VKALALLQKQRRLFLCKREKIEQERCFCLTKGKEYGKIKYNIMHFWTMPKVQSF
jgi:hypothetical protein